MQIGLSPKIQAVIATLGGPGLLLLILGIALGDDTLRTAGITALAGGALAGGAGLRASPGEVVVNVGTPSDESLDTAALSNAPIAAEGADGER